MMGRRERLIDGDEWDALTRGGRRVHRFRAGSRARVKRKFNKRSRQSARKIEFENGRQDRDETQAATATVEPGQDANEVQNGVAGLTL
jgi:hypothetical protein